MRVRCLTGGRGGGEVGAQDRGGGKLEEAIQDQARCKATAVKPRSCATIRGGKNLCRESSPYHCIILVARKNKNAHLQRLLREEPTPPWQLATYALPCLIGNTCTLPARSLKHLPIGGGTVRLPRPWRATRREQLPPPQECSRGSPRIISRVPLLLGTPCMVEIYLTTFLLHPGRTRLSRLCQSGCLDARQAPRPGTFAEQGDQARMGEARAPFNTLPPRPSCLPLCRSLRSPFA